MNEAIKLAIEKGGYEPQIEQKLFFYFMPIDEFGEVDNYDFYGAEDCIDYRAFIQDPLFWQALGKALGWIEEAEPLSGNPNKWMDWKYYAHQYLDLVLTGGDTEKFWKELLGSNKKSAAAT